MEKFVRKWKERKQLKKTMEKTLKKNCTMHSIRSSLNQTKPHVGSKRKKYWGSSCNSASWVTIECHTGLCFAWIGVDCFAFFLTSNCFAFLCFSCSAGTRRSLCGHGWLAGAGLSHHPSSAVRLLPHMPPRCTNFQESVCCVRFHVSPVERLKSPGHPLCHIPWEHLRVAAQQNQSFHFPVGGYNASPFPFPFHFAFSFPFPLCCLLTAW